MTKRIMAALLAVLMVLSLMTACGPSETESSEPESTVSGDTSASSDAEQAAVDLSVPHDIRICIQSSPNITDYQDNWLTHKMEEDLNCKITMDVLPGGDSGLSKVQLMINSGDDLPDVFSFKISSAMLYQYGTGGTFVALNDYLDNPNITPWFNAIESEEDKISMREAAMAADGNIYCLTKFQPNPSNLTPYKTYINRQWLDNLGLETPKTTDELRRVLKAFRTEDPNGNGKEDEIPLLANYVNTGNFGCNVIMSILNYFTFVPTNMSDLSLSEDGKTVIAPQISEGWKDAMQYLNDLYNDGAILPDGSFVYGSDTTSYRGTLNYQGIGTEPAEDGKSVNIVGYFSAGSSTRNFGGAGKDENVNYNEFEVLPIMKSPKCDGYASTQVYSAERRWVVTDGSKDPAFATFFGDYFYKPNMSVSARYGQEGEDWTGDEKFCSDWYKEHTAMIEAAGGKQEKESYKCVVNMALAVWSENNNHFWRAEHPRYYSRDMTEKYTGFFVPEDKRASFKIFQNNINDSLCKEYYSGRHPKYMLPLLIYNADEQESITEFQVAFPDEVLSWTMKFITGELSVEKDWDTYVNSMNNLGLENYLKCSQAAYERSIYYQANFK